MGFQRRPLVLTEWESEELQGLEVRARRLTIEEVRALQTRAEGTTRAEREHEIEEILAAAIDSWNYEDKNGQPVEPTAENFDGRVDPGLVGELVDELIRRSSQVAPPLSRPSSDGSPSVEEFKLMEPLSDGPASSPG